MAQDSRPCKGCGEPIYRTAPVAPIKHYHGPECRPRCSVDDCEKPTHSKGFCSAHATRAARKGDPLAPKERGRNEGPCEVEGCGQPMRKKRLCASHYSMVVRLGEIRDWSFRWGEGGYGPTHALLRRKRGRPETHACVDCGKAAEEWSYNGGDPAEQIDPERGAAFTRNLDAYSPRCVRCHRLYDENPISMRGTP